MRTQSLMSELSDYFQAVFYQDDVIDCYSFVTREQDPRTGFWTMLATDHTGRWFSQFTDGFYNPDGENTHLGEPVPFEHIGEVLLRHVLGRMEHE